MMSNSVLLVDLTMPASEGSIRLLMITVAAMKGILESTGETLLNITKNGKQYDAPSLSSFDPSSNASFHE